DEVDPCAKSEQAAMNRAVQSLLEEGFEPEIVGSGSTPTFAGAVRGGKINMFHPGNYVFMDAIQMALGAANERDCALTVSATIISHPQENLYICDAGAKCLGIDQGAHGCSQVNGFGIVKSHPELTVYGLSEEVGKLKAHGPCDLKIGDKIQIIPNHACSAANNTSRYFAVQDGEVIKTIAIEARSNTKI
ncbi:MAG: amino-acid racemase, partial [Firmicutes bacterium]|nr:amino-acid racemase [Bacillota bacterium]